MQLRELRQKMTGGIEQLWADRQSGIVSEDVVMKLLDYWKRRLDNPDDSIHTDFFDMTLMHTHMARRTVLSFLQNVSTGHIYCRYGVLENLIPRLVKHLEDRDRKSGSPFQSGFFDFSVGEYDEQWTGHSTIVDFTKNYSVHPDHRRAKVRYRLVHLFYSPPESEAFILDLGEIYKNYYMFHLEEIADNFIDLYSFSAAQIEKKVADKSKQPVAAVILHFQKFDDYFQVVGEHMAHEIIDEITKIIEAKKVGGDEYYRITPGIHFLIAEQTSLEELKERFHRIFFQVKGLILEYRIHFVELQSAEQLSNMWQTLFADPE